MIWTPANCKEKKLVDAVGRDIPAFSFNDETYETELFVYNRNGDILKSNFVLNEEFTDPRLEIVTARATIPGAHLVPWKRGEDYDHMEPQEQHGKASAGHNGEEGGGPII